MQNKRLSPLFFSSLFALLLVASTIYIKPAAAVSISVVDVNFAQTNTEYGHCDYIDSTEVWCPSTTGIKIYNPTTRALVTTLLSGLSINDVKCGATLCFAWDVTSGTTANLTGWITSTREMYDSAVFTGNSGFVVGHGIGLASGTGSGTVLLPVEGGSCAGTADHKGVCVYDGIGFAPARFITSSATSDTAVVYDIEWNGGVGSAVDPTANRALVKFRDAAGNFQIYNIDLHDSDTTFALTKVCDTGNVATTQQFKMQIIDGILWDAVGNQDLLRMDTTDSSCAESVKSNLVDETGVVSVMYSESDEVYIVVAYTNDATETAGVYVFNGTNFSGTAYERIAKYNTTGAAGEWTFTAFMHPSEGEIHVHRGSDMVILTDLISATSAGAGGSGDEACLDIDVTDETDIFCFEDEDGDGVPDFTWGSAPAAGADISEAIPGFIGAVFGVEAETAGLLAAIAVHGALMGGVLFVSFKFNQTMPFFVWIIWAVLSAGLSTALGFMPLFYLFVEIAIVVGAVAALVKTGVIGS